MEQMKCIQVCYKRAFCLLCNDVASMDTSCLVILLQRFDLDPIGMEGNKFAKIKIL